MVHGAQYMTSKSKFSEKQKNIFKKSNLPIWLLIIIKGDLNHAQEDYCAHPTPKSTEIGTADSGSTLNKATY